MKKAQLYITFNGNTDEAFNFYKSVFGGEFMVRLKTRETAILQPVLLARQKIAHIALPAAGDIFIVCLGEIPEFRLDADADDEAERRSIKHDDKCRPVSHLDFFEEKAA